MRSLIHLTGFYVESTGQIALNLDVSIPEKEAASEDFVCYVTCPQLFSRSMKVYGVTANQAISLAVRLVKEALTHRLAPVEDCVDEVAETIDNNANEKPNRER